MIIVSQDRDIISNFNNINTITIREHSLSDITDKKDYKIITYDNTYRSSDNYSDVLGTYKTEERAKEILQEITNAYSDFNYYKSIIDSKEQIRKGIKIYQKYRTLDVYEMPKE